MIRPGGVDPFSGRMRVIVECDADECDESHFAPGSAGAQTARDLFRDIGWQVTHTADYDVYVALCPVHALTTQGPCRHDDKYIVTPDYRVMGKPLCGRCGASREPIPPDGAVSIAVGLGRAQRALLDRARQE